MDRTLNAVNMKLGAYRKMNTVALVVMVCFQALVILGFMYAIDFFRKPNFISYVLLSAAFLKMFQLIIDYRRSRLETR